MTPRGAADTSSGPDGVRLALGCRHTDRSEPRSLSCRERSAIGANKLESLAALQCFLDRLPVGDIYSRSVGQGSNRALSAEYIRGSEAISVGELADMRSLGKEHMVLDVREASELEICQLEGALHIPMAEVAARVEDLPTNQPLVVLCHHGARSQMVVDFLRDASFDNAVNVDGGIEAWACEKRRSALPFFIQCREPHGPQRRSACQVVASTTAPACD